MFVSPKVSQSRGHNCFLFNLFVLWQSKIIYKMSKVRTRAMHKMCANCPFCIASFKTSVALQAHAVYSHRGGFFTCAWCATLIDTELKLQEHARTCTELRQSEVKYGVKSDAWNCFQLSIKSSQLFLFIYFEFLGSCFSSILYHCQLLRSMWIDVSIACAGDQALQRDSLALRLHLPLLRKIFPQKRQLRQALCRWTSQPATSPVSYIAWIANGKTSHFWKIEGRQTRIDERIQWKAVHRLQTLFWKHHRNYQALPDGPPIWNARLCEVRKRILLEVFVGLASVQQNRQQPFHVVRQNEAVQKRHFEGLQRQTMLTLCIFIQKQRRMQQTLPRQTRFPNIGLHEMWERIFFRSQFEISSL